MLFHGTPGELELAPRADLHQRTVPDVSIFARKTPEARGKVDFAGEEAARGFLATAVEIGHGEVLLELVHNNEI